MGTTRSAVVAPREARQTVFGVDGSVTHTATSAAEAMYLPEALVLLPESVLRLAYRHHHRSEPTLMHTRAGESAVKKVKKGDGGRLQVASGPVSLGDKQP